MPSLPYGAGTAPEVLAVIVPAAPGGCAWAPAECCPATPPTTACSPFLAIVVSAFRSRSTTEGIALFAAYAAGMDLIVGAASPTVALTRTTAVTRLRRLGAMAPRLGGGLLLPVGAYVAHYG